MNRGNQKNWKKMKELGGINKNRDKKKKIIIIKIFIFNFIFLNFVNFAISSNLILKFHNI